jgi:hypothetical protein
MEDAPFKQRNSPFYPDYSTTYENGFTYQGIFLNQNPNFLPYTSNYSLQSASPQTISINGRNLTFNFLNWSSPGGGASFKYNNSFSTPVVFTSANAVVEALFKGERMSNMANGLNSNSQRKITRTSDGKYHMVYTSMDNAWYTQSQTSDYEGNWIAEYPLSDQTKIRNPYITSYGNDFFIAYEEFDEQAGIAYVTIQRSDIGAPELVSEIQTDFFGQSFPVVCVNDNEVIVIYKKGLYDGLYFKTSRDNFAAETLILNTNSSSINPAVGIMLNTDNAFHMCWEENNQIKYQWYTSRCFFIPAGFNN